MACETLHSHLLLGIVTIHCSILLYLGVSDMYDLHKRNLSDPGPANASDHNGSEEIDLNGLKVIVAIGAHAGCVLSLLGALVANNCVAATRRMPPSVIVVVLIFAFVFNAAGALCLTLHSAPQHPGGFSRSVRSAKILSYAAGVYDILLTLLFCVRPPDRDSLRALKINEGGGAKTNLDATQ
ncbi:hypothetical protein Q1695_007308 [Nippostrongylus brasiliensis]|nr:hypothetical protein Q1695_007308 [Nippostrongylus brasiliensis]